MKLKIGKSNKLIFYEQEQNYVCMNKRNDEIIEFKHNIRDELVHLNGLLHGGKVPEAILYVDEISGELKKNTHIVGQNTGSRAVNASWYALVNDERYEDIVATWKGTIPVVSIGSRDMVLLFSNVLNNAFEAAVQCKDDRYVTVEVSNKSNVLFFSIKNSYHTEVRKSVGGDFLTSKKDKQYHGVGLRIVKKIIEKYDGGIEFTHLDGEFVVLISFGAESLGG